MRVNYLPILFLFIASSIFSQENQHVLFTINKEPIYAQEFINVYKKNLQIVTDSPSDLESYLKLFIDYKLKVTEAETLGLDTLTAFKNELKQYKSTLVLPYLKDKEVTRNLVVEAYNRLKKEVSVSHILIFLKPEATPKDTLAAYTKLMEVRNLILNGADFSDIAKKYSEDPTVNENGGNIGYFTVFQMVYPFENAAYTTQLNGVSKPFKTKFGYHIIKVNGIRDSKGEVEVAHIMISGDSITSKKLLDSIYTLLLTKNADFAALAKKYSDDKASAANGGKLKKFGIGEMIEEFANEAFSLKEEGEISKPFKTPFGWHIVKLIKKYTIESFDKIESELTKEVEGDERSHLISDAVLQKLFKEYKIVVNSQALEQFETEDWKKNPENFNRIVLSINDTNISQKKFITYLNKGAENSINESFNIFEKNEILEYYKENLEYSNPEFAVLYKEFKEGMLLFDLMEKQVWEKSKDSIGLLNYFDLNKKTNYKAKELKDIKGTVIADYQNYLEIMYVKQLHDTYEVSIDNSEKQRIKKLKF